MAAGSDSDEPEVRQALGRPSIGYPPAARPAVRSSDVRQKGGRTGDPVASRPPGRRRGRWERSHSRRARWEGRFAAVRAGRVRDRLHHAVRARRRTGLRTASRRHGGRFRSHRLAGGVPVHPGPARHRLPREGLDHPAVRRLRQRRRHQHALQDDPRRGRPRAFGRLRHAHPDGSRLRRRPRPGRGRPLRGGHRLGRRHGRAVRRDRSGHGHHLDDDQRTRGAGVLHVPGRRRTPGCRHPFARRHSADRHLQGVHRAEGVAVRPGAAPAPDRRSDRVLHGRTSPPTSRSRSPATTSGRPARPPLRSSPTPWPTDSATSSWG